MRLRIAIPVLLCITSSFAVHPQQQSIRFRPVREEVLWSRLEHAPASNADRELELKSLLIEAGCPPENLAEVKVSHSDTPNLICTITGLTDKLIIVGAHFDKVHAGDGMADNWSGASMLPSLLHALLGERLRHRFLFIGFTDEEKGLVGSTDYVKHLNKEEKEMISAMVNLDTLGLGPTEVWASHADKNLLNALVRTASSLKSPIMGVNVDRIGTSDSEPFREKKIPAITIHSVTSKNLHILHSPDDKLQAIQREDYAESYRLIAGYLAYLDVFLDSAPPPPPPPPRK